MSRRLACWLFALAGVLPAVSLASADEALRQGRSVAACSDQLLVCAFAKDGSAHPMDECRAQRDQSVRIVPGDCWDED